MQGRFQPAFSGIDTQENEAMDKEAYLISRLSSKYIGDDAAVIDGMVYSMDAFFEDTHFKRAWMSMAQIGRKAMLVNLSDAVAMNAHPKFALVTVSIPQDMDTEAIDELMESMHRTAAEYGCEIIGGDTIGGEKLHLSITIISRSDDPLYRKGVEEGDLLAFTGTLGESRRDLEALFQGEKIAGDSRFYEPQLRAAFIYRTRSLLSAGMDISDGLYCDTNKLLEMNGLGFEILENINDEQGFSGEEYEMLVAFKERDLEAVMQAAEETGTPLTIFAKAAKNDRRFPCKSHHFK
jgi:thiamine-monophosphate kinase